MNQAAIDALQSVQLFADTHDQGHVDDRALGNWTWLEIALYDNESSEKPRVREGVELVWQSHKNDMGSKEYDWVSFSSILGIRSIEFALTVQLLSCLERYLPDITIFWDWLL